MCLCIDITGIDFITAGNSTIVLEENSVEGINIPEESIVEDVRIVQNEPFIQEIECSGVLYEESSADNAGVEEEASVVVDMVYANSSNVSVELDPLKQDLDVQTDDWSKQQWKSHVQRVSNAFVRNSIESVLNNIETNIVWHGLDDNISLVSHDKASVMMDRNSTASYLSNFKIGAKEAGAVHSANIIINIHMNQIHIMNKSMIILIIMKMISNYL